jgi:hypothetical protein
MKNHSMRYTTTAVIAIALASMLMLVPPNALAAIRLHGSPCTITPTSTGAQTNSCVYSGLGNENVEATLSVEGFFATQCRNPAGNVAPGQNAEADAEVSSGQIQPKNGKATIPALNAIVQPPTSAEIDCPNPKWTGEAVGGFQLVSAILTITQGSTVIATDTAP